MNGYLKNITPDSFSGAVFAIEGVARSVTLVNGPSGCKFYHSATSDSQSIHQSAFDPLMHPEQYFFGQPRVPCTYLDSGDYVYGSAEKLENALAFIAENVPFELVGIINSPGAALIGDDLKGVAGRVLPDALCLTVESPGFSSDIAEGFDTTVVSLLDRLGIAPASRKNPREINILGLSVHHKYYRGDIGELRRVFGLCGIKINCFPGAGGTVREMRNMPSSALNVVIHPEFAAGTAKYLEDRCGTPALICDGPPVGFAATEKLAREVCAALGASPDGFDAGADRARAAAFAYISRVNSMTGLPKGVPFAVEGYPYDVMAYAKFLAGYFGMVLDSAELLGGADMKAREKLGLGLSGLGMADALNRDILSTRAELVLSSGSIIAALRQQGHRFCGIEISLPSLGYLDVIPKTHLGLRGALLLTEQILNGLLF